MSRVPATRRSVVVGIVGVLVSVVSLAALGAQALRGNGVVDVQLQVATKHDAALDDAFYRCIDVQAHSVVSPEEPVMLVAPSFSDWVTLSKGVGSWVRIAPTPASARVELTLRDQVKGRPACLGTVVEARPVGHRGAVRVGRGADVPGSGPPPAPPL